MTKSEKSLLGEGGSSSSVLDGPGRPSQGGRKPWIRRLILVMQASLVPLLGLLVWYAVTRTKLISPIKLPKPERVVASAIEMADILPSAFVVSIRMVLTGMALGTVTGLSAGLIFGYSPFVRRFFEATFDNFVRPVPFFALIPLFILWFGIGMMPQIALVALAIFLMFSLTTLETIRNVPHIYVQAALTAGASRGQIYRTVVVPAILPHLVGFLRLAAAAAWGLDVAAEFFGSRTGLGFIMLVRQQYLDPAGMITIVLIFCTLAVIFDQTARLVAARLTKWSPRADRGLVGSMLGN